MQKTFLPADIILPKKGYEEWAVIACDQYTSDGAYWDSVKNIVGDSDSAFNMILPEYYLESDKEARIAAINNNMDRFLQSNSYTVYHKSLIYVERTITGGAVRRGLVGMVDLADYDYNKGSNALIRATEATVLERIPPRVQIRKNASLELPHVMLLIDDPNETVLEPIAAKKESLKSVYDFDLMMNGGHISGYLTDEATTESVMSALTALIENQSDPLLFAVGDGNHSLATAKACYDRDPNELNRYALVEIVNIHDDALDFEPIYRVLFDVDPEKFLDKMLADFGGEYSGCDAQEFTCIYNGGEKTIHLKPTSELSVGTLQKYLDESASEIKIDYIHDESSVRKLCAEKNTLGFLFDSMKKSELFPAVKADGALPRKTFSMGHADDKRFYIEARKIK